MFSTVDGAVSNQNNVKFGKFIILMVLYCLQYTSVDAFVFAIYTYKKSFMISTALDEYKLILWAIIWLYSMKPCMITEGFATVFYVFAKAVMGYTREPQFGRQMI